MIVTLLTLVVIAVSGTATLAADAPRIQIVFDGSGSMWGKIPGDPGPKFAVVREALRQALPRVSRSTQLGMTIFGHRRRGDCSDVEVAQPLAAADTDRILAPLEKLNPKGRGPLSLAMVEAADSLSHAGARDTLILVHDDPDNCQADPCATVADLNRVRPRLTIHVISLGLRPEDAERMACVARITGGRSFNVQDAPSAANAVAEALRLAALQVPGGMTRPSTQSAPEQERESGPAGLRLSAVLAAGGEELARPLNWRIYRQGRESGVPLVEVKEAAPRLSLPPGTYTVEVGYSQASARREVEVASDRPTHLVVALNAGAIRFPSSAKGDAGPSETAIVSLFEHDDRDPSKGRVVWVGPAPEAEVVVPAGTYRAVFQDRLFRAERVIVVPAGSTGAPVLASAAGRLRLSARDHSRAEQPADRVLFRILEDDPAAPEGRREVARSAARAPRFTLPAGTYHVVASKGAAEIRELIALRAGDDVRRTLDLRLATVSLSTRISGTLALREQDISYRVRRLDSAGQPADTEVVKSRAELPAGRYRVEVRLGRQNAEASREIDLKEGVDQDVILEPQAALVQLRLAGQGQAHLDTYWEIRDSSGRIVWRTAEAEPRGYLAAGHYTVRAETRERTVERKVEIRTGQTATLELAID